ncbi:MAG: 3',5'-cyclic-nucleotide phosphodiesterase [Betaproteobacteria bacterium RIFCSPLOWO2_02_FULL_67_26]|nr:MAG: 3',5'-cyclic-nucleotide phosphodiesterase [Betaproteobacteria bacterium RIFCSPLOWO2_02_FULL_67_26]
MKLRVLGCSGGIGGDLRTTTLLLDHDTLIDAGTGVGDLSINELAQIDHVFVTHSHMDHVASIPFIVDTVGWMRDKPLTLHATRETLAILKEHLFNWKLWPDFSRIPDAANPALRYEAVALGDAVALDGRRITPLPANHVVPAVGYQLDSGTASLVFTGDTTSNDALWPVVNRIVNLKYLIIETALSDREEALARVSKHLCPSLLAGELAKLKLTPEIYITHLKPRESELIMQQVAVKVKERRPKMLQNNHVFEF